MISYKVRQKVRDRINECLEIIEKRYMVSVPAPKDIHYEVRGTTGGKAFYRSWTLGFNPILLRENEELFIKQTVTHEIAHLITHFIYPHAKAHGYEWKRIMVVLGAEPSRTHSYDTTRSQVKVKHKFLWTCQCCSTQITVGPVVHKKMIRGQQRFHSKCGRAGTLVFHKGLGQVTYRQAATMKKK